MKTPTESIFNHQPPTVGVRTTYFTRFFSDRPTIFLGNRPVEEINEGRERVSVTV